MWQRRRGISLKYTDLAPISQDVYVSRVSDPWRLGTRVYKLEPLYTTQVGSRNSGSVQNIDLGHCSVR